MIECLRYSPVNKSTCLGVATILVKKWGVEISGISLHQKDGKRWINFPARIVEPLQGNSYQNEEAQEDQKPKYYPYLKFVEKSHKDKFCEVVKKAIDVYNEKIASQNQFEDKMPEGEVPF